MEETSREVALSTSSLKSTEIRVGTGEHRNRRGVGVERRKEERRGKGISVKIHLLGVPVADKLLSPKD